jgi:hypothetical protein
MHRKPRLLSVLAPLLLLVSCTNLLTTVRKHPDLTARLSKVERVGLLPFQVRVDEKGADGSLQPLPELGESLRPKLRELVAWQLQKAGLSVAELEIAASEGTDEERFLLTQVENSYAAAAASMYAQPAIELAQAERYSVSLGPQVAEIAQSADVDVVVAARLTGFQPTRAKILSEGAKAITLALVGGSAPMDLGSATLEVALVDGNDGYVLWSNRDSKPFPPALETLEPLVTSAFEALPPVPRAPVASAEAMATLPLSGAVGSTSSGETAPSDAVAPLRSFHDVQPVSPTQLVGRDLFLCCNLVFDSDLEATDSGYLLKDDEGRVVLPAGTPVHVTRTKKNWVEFTAEGFDGLYTLYLEYGEPTITATQFFPLVLQGDDPRTQLSAFPADVQAAIRDGRLLYGMTRAQAVMARGYPPFHQTADVGSPTWLYYDDGDVGQYVGFTDGRISLIKVGETP